MGCESIGLVTHCSFLEEIHPKFTHPPLRQVTSGALRLVSGSHNSPSPMPVSLGIYALFVCRLLVSSGT